MSNNPRGSGALSETWSHMFYTRMAFLALAAIWGGVAGGLSLNAVVELRNTLNNARSFIDGLENVHVDTRNVYIPGVLTCVSAFCIAAFALITIGIMGWRAAKNKKGKITPDSVVFQGVFMALFALWMLITLTTETVFYSTARPVITVNGEPIGTRFDGTVLIRPYKYFYNVRTGIILLWFCWIFTCICSAVLFIVAASGPKKEAGVYTSAQINDLAERQRNDPNIEHLTRPLDPDEVEKKRSPAQRAHPTTADPSPMSEKPTEMGSTSAANAV